MASSSFSSWQHAAVDHFADHFWVGLAFATSYIGAFWGTVALHRLLSLLPGAEAYRVQPVPSRKRTPEWTIVKHIFMVDLTIIFPALFAFVMFVGPSGVLPSWPRLTANFLFAFVFGDFLLYWIHRISHWPQFYWFHKLHHENTASFDIVSNYMHPFELVGAATTGVLLVMSHPLEVIFITVIRAYLDVEHHCGYAFPWSPQNWLPGFVGAHFHDFHHEAFVGNYGVILTVWDHIFGTVSAAYPARWESFKKQGTPITGANPRPGQPEKTS